MDNIIKYGFIISNFIMIISLIIYNKFFRIYEEIQKTNLLLVIAHPDDESMFFRPCIEELTQTHNIYCLILSNGNFDKLGLVREKEMEQAAKFFKFIKIYFSNFDDGMQNQWDLNKISEIIDIKVNEWNIQTIISFDQYGISGHPNHQDTYKGSKIFADKNKQVKFYTLQSVNIFRKYLSILDFFLCFFNDFIFVDLNILRSYKSMQIHKSQFVWYRKLFVIFSRYSFINTLIKIQ